MEGPIQTGVGDRHFRVFISSTFRDLESERKKAIEVVVNKGHIPVALERFSASNESDLQVIERAIRECQVYVLILGHRYGELIPDKQISYTELEYQIAEEHGLLVLPFILKEIKKRRKDLNKDDIHDHTELGNYERLCAFHGKVGKRFYQLWGPEDEFSYLVEKALNDHLGECEKPGLIPEPEQPLRGLLTSASRNEFIVDVVKKLSGFARLDARCSEQAKKKQALAAFFREKYIDQILANRVSLFFESGSTIAYLARALSEPLTRFSEHAEKPTIDIRTNNVLAYLQLWLNARVPCTLFPWGPPEQTYGASFGSLAQVETISPNYSQPPLDEIAVREIERLLNAPYTLTNMDHPALLLGATSGLQLSEPHQINFTDDTECALTATEREQVTGEISECYGPHVGSYHNKVFKRFMYQTKLPLMIFITGDKIDSTIRAGICHFICDSDYTWETFYKRHPLAFCVGVLQEKASTYTDMFRNLGFEIHKGRNYSPVTAFIARNRAFINGLEDNLRLKV